MKYCKKALEKFYHCPLPIACYISLAASAVVCLLGAFQGSSGLSIMAWFRWHLYLHFAHCPERWKTFCFCFSL